VHLEIKFSTRMDSPACIDLYDHKIKILTHSSPFEHRPEEESNPEWWDGRSKDFMDIDAFLEKQKEEKK